MLVSDDEADEEKNEHEFDSSLEEDIDNTNSKHDINLSISDENA